jgi:hypothetical protein
MAGPILIPKVCTGSTDSREPFLFPWKTNPFFPSIPPESTRKIRWAHPSHVTPSPNRPNSLLHIPGEFSNPEQVAKNPMET